MDYLDTSYVVALAVKTDVNHNNALRLEREVEEPIISSLVAAEVYTYYSRTLSRILGKASLEDYEEKIEAMVEYSIKRCKAKLLKVNLNDVVEQVRNYAPKIPLKTLDLIHLLIAKALGATRIVTLDSDFYRKRNQIKKWLNLNILTIGRNATK